MTEAVTVVTKRKRICAVLFAAVLCFVAVFSAFIIAAEANHDCIGDGCVFCSCIDICENALKTLTSISVAVLLCISSVSFAAICVCGTKSLIFNPSLVFLKVKLSD